MLWSRKPNNTVHSHTGTAGVDLSSTRLRAAIRRDAVRALAVEDPHDELAIMISLDGKTPRIGRVARALARKLPHAVAVNLLPDVTHSREWKVGRTVITADAAIQLAFETAKPAIRAEADAVGLALPGYLSVPQATRVAELAMAAKVPVVGTVHSALALAAERAPAWLAADTPLVVEEPTADWVVPLRPSSGGPGTVMVIDADDHALSATVIAIEKNEVRILSDVSWPKLSVLHWVHTLLDSLSDRCVRLCRRDPRDSAEAEQLLFDQLPSSLDKIRYGQTVRFDIRAAHWYQDVSVSPTDAAQFCNTLVQTAIAGVMEQMQGQQLPGPPRAVWMTTEAGLLPGLANALYQCTPEGTDVTVLGRDSVAVAAAGLAGRWQSGELPKIHLDTVVPLVNTTETINTLRPAKRG